MRLEPFQPQCVPTALDVLRYPTGMLRDESTPDCVCESMGFAPCNCPKATDESGTGWIETLSLLGSPGIPAGGSLVVSADFVKRRALDGFLRICAVEVKAPNINDGIGVQDSEYFIMAAVCSTPEWCGNSFGWKSSLAVGDADDGVNWRSDPMAEGAGARCLAVGKVSTEEFIVLRVYEVCHRCLVPVVMPTTLYSIPSMALQSPAPSAVEAMLHDGLRAVVRYSPSLVGTVHE